MKVMKNGVLFSFSAFSRKANTIMNNLNEMTKGLTQLYI